MNIKKINKILIANRGEIAVRIIKTAKKLGIETVAIYSDVDALSLFVDMADEKFLIGPAPASQSYLLADKIIEIAKESGADAIHPGYGFLAEKYEFVKQLEDENITFIGPSSKSISMVGDKIAAKKTAIAAGINVVPGFVGTVQNEKEAISVAEQIGFPIIIKASSGGGGKGLKIVYNKEEVADAITSAQNEARNSFGDDRIFIEKYIENPRHIEIQVIGDKHGNVVCLGERECSIQRFNQKIIEESPSPFLDEQTRKEMYRQSIMLSKAVGYYSAGTVEYIVDQNKNFYFLEMNTRIQVEHPVTEFVTQKDLVELMIVVAQGGKLPFVQEDIKIRGWSMESRICAEDPAKNFLPSVGRITRYVEPKEDSNTRIDSGIMAGSEITQFYDAMIAKLITYGDSRNEAIKRMRSALSEFEVDGIAHNISFLEAIMINQNFIDGNISTNFIKQEYKNGFKGVSLNDITSKIFLSAATKAYLVNEEKYYATTGKLDLVRNISNRFLILIDGKEYNVYVQIKSNQIEIRFGNIYFSINSDYKSGERILKGKLDGSEISVKIKFMPEGFIMNSSGVTSYVIVRPIHIADIARYVPQISLRQKIDKLLAPISGKLISIKVVEGEEVVEGQELVTIEAMKMENIIRAEFDGRVKGIHLREKDNITINDVIMTFDFNTNDV